MELYYRGKRLLFEADENTDNDTKQDDEPELKIEDNQDSDESSENSDDSSNNLNTEEETDEFEYLDGEPGSDDYKLSDNNQTSDLQDTNSQNDNVKAEEIEGDDHLDNDSSTIPANKSLTVNPLPIDITNNLSTIVKAANDEDVTLPKFVDSIWDKKPLENNDESQNKLVPTGNVNITNILLNIISVNLLVALFAADALGNVDKQSNNSNTTPAVLQK